jgi:hypothetical protein
VLTQRGARRQACAVPGFIESCRPTLREAPPGGRWIHEIRLTRGAALDQLIEAELVLHRGNAEAVAQLSRGCSCQTSLRRGQ